MGKGAMRNVQYLVIEKNTVHLKDIFGWTVKVHSAGINIDQGLLSSGLFTFEKEGFSPNLGHSIKVSAASVWGIRV